MKIQGSDLLLASQHVAIKEETNSESLKMWIGSRRPEFENSRASAPLPAQDSIDWSRPAREVNDVGKDKPAVSKSGKLAAGVDTDPISMLIRMLTKLLTGKDIKITSMQPGGDGVDPEKAAELKQEASAAQAQTQPDQQPPPQVGFGLEYDAVQTTVEAESMNFSAQGIVRTTDGKQIDFNLQLSMERLFASKSSVSLRLGDAVQQKDPLMINFDGSAAQLTDTKFSFDIDADGNLDQVSFAGPNSGLIALDKNNDGRINDGSELFGTDSGNGFNDLSAYDQDKNGWIDENDAVFSQLKVWTKDAQGNDSITGLMARGIGALYLGNTATQFDLKTAGNDSLGTVRASGVYLGEDGKVGTLQQVDLTL